MTDLAAASQTEVAPDPGLDPAVAREVAAAHLAAIVASSADAILSKNLDGIIIVGTPGPSACSATEATKSSAGRSPG